MPRLSVIIPHRHDDQRLEETILSVLENRPRDCEVIVVHDGTYRDPYALADEVVYVQEEPHSSTVQLLNAGLMAACSPVVCTLIDGTHVAANWAEPALKRFARTVVASVAPQLQIGRTAVTGISGNAVDDATRLRSGRLESHSEDIVAPTLAAGFYRRKVLLAIGGWNEQLGPGSADVELAILLSDLGLNCEHEAQVIVQAASSAIPSRKSAAVSKELASIAASHRLATSTLASNVMSIIAAVFTGTVASSMAWSSGLRNSVAIDEISNRLNHAHQQLGTRQEPAAVKLHREPSAITQQRRAA